MMIEYVDLAEEVIYCVDRICDDCPLSVLKAGGLAAILQYLDFFGSSVQRKAITAASKMLGPWKAKEIENESLGAGNTAGQNRKRIELFETVIQPGREEN